MLESITLGDFKSFADQTATIAPFTLLVGANASGKSNFLDALRFLHGLSQGWTLSEVLGGRVTGGVSVWPGIRGGVHGATRSGCARFSIESKWKITGDNYGHSVTTDGSEIVRESLDNLWHATNTPDASDPRRPLLVECESGSMLNAAPERTRADVSAMTTYAGSAGFSSGFKHTLGAIRFLDLHPERMRGYSDKPTANANRGLVSDGSNLSSVLWSLSRDAKTHAELVDWLTEFCAPEVTDIEFEETKSDSVLMSIVERDGSRVSAKSMSDGTLRFLALLAALKSAGPGSTLVVEDLDHGMHPSRLGDLVQAIESVTHRGQQFTRDVPVVIATTHSPTLIEAAMRRPDSEAAILLFARAIDAEGTQVRDVRTLPGIDEVLTRRDFHYLFGTGWLERAV